MSRIFPRAVFVPRLIFSLSLFLLLCGPMSLVSLAFEGSAPAHLQCEGMQEPLGIDITHPRLAWQFDTVSLRIRQLPADSVWCVQDEVD